MYVYFTITFDNVFTIKNGNKDCNLRTPIFPITLFGPSFMDISAIYDINTTQVSYRDNREYREFLRKVFKMDDNVVYKSPENALLSPSDIDSESWDEMLFDSGSVSRAMDAIFRETIDHPLFCELYESAAAHMISTDKTIGQAVLMSYDYFHMYHGCLCVYFKTPDAFNETCVYYRNLKNALR